LEDPSFGMLPVNHADDFARVSPTGDVESAEAELACQRLISEQVLLAALRKREASTEAASANRRATFLATASRELALSLDVDGALETIRRRSLPREGSWCIVEVVEPDGAVRRLPVAHPDLAKQPAAQMLADRWLPALPGLGASSPWSPNGGIRSMDGATTLQTPGVGCLIVVPLRARETVLGAIAFLAEKGDVPFSLADVSLASDLADLCALALDNGRRYRQAREFGEAAYAESRAKSTFLGNVSHELITPLNAIGGYVTLIEMGLRGPVSAEQLADLARIRHNQAHMLSLISEILTFVRSETGRLEYSFAEVSVDAMLRTVAEMLDGAAAERGLRLVHQAGDPTAVIWADPDRVRQILVNLVMNAVKYAAECGGEILLSASTSSQAVAMHVADEGPGIPSGKLNAVFDPFVQLATGRSNRRGGVGLGLAISRDFARAMNGDLTVESRVAVDVVGLAPDGTATRAGRGSGCTFTLTLPVNRAR
jgi:signal transduction histidine kinase